MWKVGIVELVGVVNMSVIEGVHKFPSLLAMVMIGVCGGWDDLADTIYNCAWLCSRGAKGKSAATIKTNNPHLCWLF